MSTFTITIVGTVNDNAGTNESEIKNMVSEFVDKLKTRGHIIREDDPDNETPTYGAAIDFDGATQFSCSTLVPLDITSS